MEVNYRTQTLPLDSNWRFREALTEGIPEHNRISWLPARVPGHVHLDLMRAGVIADPYARMQERSAQWIDDIDWVYETQFLYENSNDCPVYLRFQGLDTVAEILVNGINVGSAENMFMPHEFRIDAALNSVSSAASLNTIQVKFSSAKNLGVVRQCEWNEGPDAITNQWDIWAPRSFVRKAQYMYGWDWGPVLISCGIWQPVSIVTAPTARFRDWRYSYRLIDSSAEVEIFQTIERTPAHAETPLKFRVSLGGDSAETAVPTGAGPHTVSVVVRIANPRLWMPNGLNAPGESPTLYSITREVVKSEFDIIESLESKIGIRRIELLHEPDGDGSGESFQFRINNIGIFAKGANWIPNDSFPSLTTTTHLQSLRQRIIQARDAGFNMLRVWGGGLYETEEFYSLCDEYGLMVWQDFAYGCAYYPDTGSYAEAAKTEAVTAVRRIRNHPSLALWCGNNENNTMFHSDWNGLKPPRHVGERIYHKILPEVIEAENPEVPYWPSSPFGGDNPDSQDFGDCHNWDVWHGRGDWVNYSENDTRFCSEFGFASSCSLAAWRTVMSKDDTDPRSPVVRWHEKTRKGYDTYLSYINIHYPSIETLEDLVYYSQINQAEALKFGVEHYRRRMGRCWGTLYWQLNDCWPVQSWSVIDSLGVPKAAYYASKKFYAPVLLSLKKEEGLVSAYLVTDLQVPQAGMLTLTIQSFTGEVISEVTSDVVIGANQSARIGEICLSQSSGREHETFVKGVFVPNQLLSSKAPIENTLLLAEPKHLQKRSTQPEVSVQAGTPGTVEISITAAEFAPYVWLRLDDNRMLDVSDNFFHVAPGETRTVIANSLSGLSPAEFAGQLIVRTL